MVEYTFYEGKFAVDIDDTIDEDVELEVVYDNCLDGQVVYLAERDDAKAKRILADYYKQLAETVLTAKEVDATDLYSD